MTELAPIVLFSYNRPTHLRQTLMALKANQLADQSILYIYCDGPRVDATAEEVARIASVRQIAREHDWCKEVHVIEREHNHGLVDSVLSGVTDTVGRYGRVIVLEDDIVTSRYFLTFMNQALDVYQDSTQVMHISGYIYPHKHTVSESTAFLRILSCWGWATWSRAWQHYSHDVADHYSYFGASPDRIRSFDIEGSADYFYQLTDNLEGTLYSWAVRWYASWLRHGGISIFPRSSLVRNIGHDGSGENCVTNHQFDTTVAVDCLHVEMHSICENVELRQSIDEFYASRFDLERRDSRSGRTIREWILRWGNLSSAKRLMRKTVRAAVLSVVPELEVSTENVPWQESQSYRFKVRCEEDVKLYGPYQLYACTIGMGTYVSTNARISMTRIGRYCSIGPNCLCGGGVHSLDGISTSPMFYSTLKQNGITLSGNDKIAEREHITIGSDVFIGANVTILDGVSIGDGAVIGAGSVVSKDVLPYSIVAGSPIRLLRYRFSNDVVSALMSIRWWDWDRERLQEVENLYFDVDEFVRKNLRDGVSSYDVGTQSVDR